MSTITTYKTPLVYAILGATGSTGSSILAQLLERPPNSVRIHVFVRSTSRLELKFPRIFDRKNVSIFTGSMSVNTLLPCIRGASVIFNSIGVNKPAPDIRIAQETAESIIGAVSIIKKESSDYMIPHVIYLASASLNKVALEKEHAFPRLIILNGLYYIYEDQRRAIQYFRSKGEASGLIQLSLACPGAIFQSSSNGNASQNSNIQVSLSEHRGNPMISYSELAKGFIEMAENEKWKGKEVLVSGTLPPAYGQLFWLIIGNVVPGLCITFFPRLYPVFTALGVL